jgi:hypothetical protein
MKKKLLITLGCSFTEGVGCYDPLLLDTNGKPIYDEGLVYNSSVDRFHTLGWPAKLQKKLQYDCLWNLGHGAASNSENVKRWTEIFSTKKISDEYDVLVIWMLTFSGRISFYKDGKIRSVLPGSKNPTDVNHIFYNSYLNFLGDNFNKDMILEMYFYVNIIKTICELSNYKFLYINTSNSEGRDLDLLTKSTNSLNFAYKTLYPEYNSVLDRNDYAKYSAFCGHPNENGYELIAERLFQMILHEHKYLVNNNTPETYDMLYLGEPRQW